MTDIPFLKRKTQHRIGKSGRRSEQRLARLFAARSRPASGAMEGAKGDIDLGAVLLEAKSTTRASMSLKFDWLIKISREARSEGKMPALSVSFIREDGTPHVDGDWALIPMHRFKELLP